VFECLLETPEPLCTEKFEELIIISVHRSPEAKTYKQHSYYFRAQLRSSNKVFKVYLIAVDVSVFVEVTGYHTMSIRSCNSNFIVTEEPLELVCVRGATFLWARYFNLKNVNFKAF
jgi:hypothetical protein